MQKVISIVIPVYHNEGSLIPSYETIKAEINTELPDYDYEFVFVNDGSKDGSLTELLKLKERDAKKVKVINFSRNFGQFAALNAGLHHCNGDYSVCISADQQDPPEVIHRMIEKVNEGADIVLAVRESRSDGFVKDLTANTHVWLIRKSAKNYPKGGFDSWLMNRKAINAYKKYNDYIRSNQIDVLSLGFNVTHIFYNRKKREVGESQYNFRKRLNVSLNQLFSISAWPLRMVSIIGLFTTLIGFIYGFRVIMVYFTAGTPFKGYAPIILLQLLIGGIIMMMLGIIGEYQWRIFYETKNRPLYIIDEIF